MALPDPDSIGPDDVGIAADAFLQQSYLTYIIPFATNFDPEDALGRGENSVESKISNIEQRDRLFFGMRFAHCSPSCVSQGSFAGRR